MNSSDFFSLAQIFLTQLFQDMAKVDVTLADHWEIDHLCYRTETEESYQRLKIDFKKFGHLLIESEVNGRMIATYKLFQPVIFQKYRIGLVELPSPKKGKVTAEGFEHIEIVCDVPFSELQERYKHLKLDNKGLSKKINPELEVCLGERNIKFHHSSLEAVINLENNLSN